MLPAVGRRILDQLLPPLCLRCDAPVGEPHGLCSACWQQLVFITAPHCPCCGVPYELARDDLVCPTCLQVPPLYKQARAALVYDAASRPLLVMFKHSDRTQLANALARLMLQAGRALLTPEALLVPVPLHRWRLLRRCYNQSALLAQQIGREAGLRVVPDLLCRMRATPPQARLKAAARARNVQAAFRVAPQHAERVRGRTIVLVDDVMTTGATINECTRALLAAHAAEVRVLTCARTL
jgi:ComF family protein